jgi:hypothetical protein
LTIKLDRQIYLYRVDTSAFYNNRENQIHNKLLKSYKYKEFLNSLDEENIKRKQYINNRIRKLKTQLKNEINSNDKTRVLRKENLTTNRIISLFDSVLTRTFGIKKDELTEDIIIVQVYYFQILEDLIKNGFIHNSEKYVYFTSSAGQIRTKKAVFVKESLLNKHIKSLMCGLTIDKINSQGGVNINKFQAYLALSNSATDEWKRFNIHKAIVVDDLETDVYCEVDYIDHNTYKIKRQKMNVPITHTDGCGMILPKKIKKSFMCRLPWIKGLLVPFPFDEFAKQYGYTKVKDIYGKEWDIIKDDIQIIFTKSQFKMWKYYKDWDDYKKNFIKYKCQAAKLNEEDVTNDAKFNYQMLQTLTDITHEELELLSKMTVKDIFNIGNDKETMLRVLGATKTNKRKNYFQQALSIYPELLNDEHAKQVIKDKKKSLIKEAKSGKLNVNGKYTFLCPDLYAFCEKLFLNSKNPKGLLKNGEVYCDIFNEGKVDVLRSPHLYREHSIKKNILKDDYKKWFITRGIYTSIHDPISKMLQFDNDGDKALVIQDETLINVAERNMKDIVPLYYEMAKAPAENINSEGIYKSLIAAYKANIGEISNNITKIWNNKNPNLDVVKWLTMENNFTIDFAKTLYMPTRPQNIDKVIKQYIKAKLPYFFIYAKDKKKENVDAINDSTVNKLNNIIPNKPIKFQKIAGKMDYTKLMKNKNVNLNSKIVEAFTELEKNKKKLMSKKEDLETHDISYFYKMVRNEMSQVHDDTEYITDVLIKYLYKNKNSRYKSTLWNTFGDIIVKNIKNNLKNTICCESCGKRVKSQSFNRKYCDDCSHEIQKKRQRESMRKIRKTV